MSGKWLIGVDIGGTTTKIAFIQDYGEIIEKWEIPTDNENQGKSITIGIFLNPLNKNWLNTK